MEHWFKFSAYNSAAYYGYGTAEEADKFADNLNRGREFNVYSYRAMDDDETDKLNSGDNTDGFALAEALEGQADMDEREAAGEFGPRSVG